VIPEQPDIGARAARPVDVRARAAIVVANVAALSFIARIDRSMRTVAPGEAPMNGSMHRRGMGPALALVLVIATSDCSYAFVHGPPPEAEVPPVGEHPSPSCTTSNAAPVVDTVLSIPLVALGLVGVAGAIGTKSCSSGCYVNVESGELAAIGVVGLALGALTISSAVTGYGRTADCRRLQEAVPGPPHPSERYLLDVDGIAQARVHMEVWATASVH
jgi:hypothetical protein